MKTKLLLAGFLVGVGTGIVLTMLLAGQRVMANGPGGDGGITRDRGGMRDRGLMPNGGTGGGTGGVGVDWPDSLDAVVAAPANHKVVFENDKIRILEVIGEPYVFEPLHTHRWPSVMWSASPNFAKAHLIYYNYGYDPVKKTYFIKDSTLEQGPPANKGFSIPSEGLHRVRNLSNLDILAYRVEFKK
jgi:hypothetical protein